MTDGSAQDENFSTVKQAVETCECGEFTELKVGVVRDAQVVLIPLLYFLLNSVPLETSPSNIGLVSNSHVAPDSATGR